MEALLKNSESKDLYEHMSSKNYTQAELDQMKRKKRKLNEISKSSSENAEVVLNKADPAKEQFKAPPPKKTAQEIKECPFNPFGDDSCDMCGA